jgi:hypothetical protein
MRKKERKMVRGGVSPLSDSVSAAPNRWCLELHLLRLESKLCWWSHWREYKHDFRCSQRRNAECYLLGSDVVYSSSSQSFRRSLLSSFAESSGHQEAGLASSSTLNREAVSFSETSTDFYQTTPHHIRQDGRLAISFDSSSADPIIVANYRQCTELHTLSSHVCQAYGAVSSIGPHNTVSIRWYAV